MQWFLLGLAALVAGVIALRWASHANVAPIARGLRLVIGAASLAAAFALAIRGAVGYALPLSVFGLYMLFNAPASGRFGGTRGAGNTSQVTTDHLEMEPDLDTGDMRGRVLKGVFEARQVERMAPAELAILWRDCEFADPASARLIEAYLERVHPSWREDMARAESEPGVGGRMSRDEAFDILGLQPGASEDAIRNAHRELMKRLHPDRGGSSYLAAKINQAKDVLLKA